MCGIAGIISRDADVRPHATRFDLAVDSMRARGPDDRGTCYRGRVALGARRLSIIDLATGSQPILSEDGAVCVVQNGELYSHRELRDELERAGHRFASRSDTEVLVHGYEEWGIEGLLERIDGMFAFALHDARTDDVYIARDRLGIKPLLYAETADAFCFASTVTALIVSGHVTPAPDPAGIRLYLHNQFTSAPHTVLAGVLKLPPASYLHIRQGHAQAPRRYWQIPTEVESLDEHEWQERLRATLTAAVERHCVSDVEVGTYLSGGLDSSIILALLSEAGRSPKAFSVGVDGGDAYDETAFAREMAERFRADFLPCRFGVAEFAEVAGRVVEAMEEPIADPACLPSYLLSAHASKFVKVALSGEGADELFGGYGYYRRFTTMRGRALHRIAGSAKRSRLSGYPYPLVASECDALLRELPCDSSTSEIERSVDERISATKPSGALNAALAADLGTWLPDDLLTKTDRMSMAHSLELRVPFLDHRVVELAFRMPPALKRRGASGKLILKETFAASVGTRITNRPKHGFNLPLGAWMRDGAGPMVAEWMGDTWSAAPWLDRAIVTRIVRDHNAGVADNSRQIWLLFVLTHWFQAITAIPSRT